MHFVLPLSCLNPYCSGRWSRTEKFDEFTAHMWDLILIVVEDGLVHAQRAALDAADHGLNPYCSGRWSRTLGSRRRSWDSHGCLNPYCSGRWSRTMRQKVWWLKKMLVLILIVVEDGLVQYKLLFSLYGIGNSLNPYCSGRWSRTYRIVARTTDDFGS